MRLPHHFRNDKTAVFLLRRIGQYLFTVKMFYLLIVAKGVGQENRVGSRADAFGVNLIEFVDVIQNGADLIGKPIQRRLLKIQPGQICNIQNFFLGYFHRFCLQYALYRQIHIFKYLRFASQNGMRYKV